MAIEARAALQEYEEGDQDPATEALPQIAVMCIEGPLEQRAGWFGAGYDTIRAKFEALLASEASAVVLKINSPGGDAAGNIECARAMVAAKEAAGKPVWAFADEAAYSAAYALACVADRIYLPDTGGVGSIGCLCVAADMSEMVKKAGVNAVVVRSGSRKAEGHPLIPLDKATLSRFQNRVDGLANIFADFVASRRGGKRSKYLALEGACLYGADAVKAGIANGVMGFDAMIEKLGSVVAQLAPPLDGVPSAMSPVESRGLEKSDHGERPMTLEQLKAALAAAQAAGDAAKVVALQAQIASFSADRSEDEDSEDEGSDEESEDEGSEEESDEESADDDGDDDDDADPEEEEEETKRTTTTKTYRRSKKSQAAVAATVEEMFPGLSPAQIRGRLAALKSSHDAQSNLQAEVKKLKMKNRANEVESMLSRGAREGKVPRGERESLRAMGMRSPKALKEYLAVKSPVVSLDGLTPSLETPAAGGLTVQEIEIASRMGVSQEAFAAQKARMSPGQTGITLSRI